MKKQLVILAVLVSLAFLAAPAFTSSFRSNLSDSGNQAAGNPGAFSAHAGLAEAPFTFTDDDGDFTFDRESGLPPFDPLADADTTPMTPVPEPGTIFLVGTGCLLALGLIRRAAIKT